MITTRPAVLATLLAACQGDPKAGPAGGDGTSVGAGKGTWYYADAR